jgi:hypothetical protein
MVTRTISETGTGSAISYGETEEERLKRIADEALKASQELGLSPGQAQTLRRGYGGTRLSRLRHSAA